jgi:hypothetical protein
VFGPNATVNVMGSFHASTADYVKMSDGAKFQVTNPDPSTLSMAPPVAFGFLTAQPKAIMVNGNGVNSGFGVPSGQTLGLVAGPVTISGARLSAPAGTIHVTGVAGVGEVPVNPGDTSALTVSSFGQVDIRGGGPTSGTLDVTTAGTGAGGSVNVTTPGTLVLDGAGVANTQIAASAIGPQSGSGGAVTIGANALTVEGGAQIASSTAGPGKGGDVGVTVVDSVTLSGSGPNGASGISAAALPGSSGAAGQVVLTAGGVIALMGGAGVTSSTAGAGRGGSVQVTAGGR